MTRTSDLLWRGLLFFLLVIVGCSAVHRQDLSALKKERDTLVLQKQALQQQIDQQSPGVLTPKSIPLLHEMGRIDQRLMSIDRQLKNNSGNLLNRQPQK